MPLWRNPVLSTVDELRIALQNLNPMYYTTLAKVISLQKNDVTSTLTVELLTGERIAGVTHNHEGEPAVGATCLVTFRDNKQSRPHASDFSKYASIEMNVADSLVKVDKDEISFVSNGLEIIMKEGKITLIADTIQINGELKATGEVTAMSEGPGVKLSTHMHPSATPGAPSSPTQGT